MQAVAEQNQKHVVGNVEMVVLDFVVGAPVVVFALAVLVVAAPIFKAAAVDARGDGRGVAGGIVVAERRVGVVFGVVLLMLVGDLERGGREGLLAVNDLGACIVIGGLVEEMGRRTTDT